MAGIGAKASLENLLAENFLIGAVLHPFIASMR
jgi:hypothetical protein